MEQSAREEKLGNEQVTEEQVTEILNRINDLTSSVRSMVEAVSFDPPGVEVKAEQSELENPLEIKLGAVRTNPVKGIDKKLEGRVLEVSDDPILLMELAHLERTLEGDELLAAKAAAFARAIAARKAGIEAGLYQPETPPVSVNYKTVAIAGTAVAVVAAAGYAAYSYFSKDDDASASVEPA